MTRVVPFVLILLLIAGCAQPSIPDSGAIATAVSGVHGGVQTAVVRAHALGGISTRAADVVAAARTKVVEAETAVVAVAQTRLPEPHGAATPARTQARVTRIVDGDTIVVAIGDQTYRLRYIGIDSPEGGQTLGAEATAANEALVAGETIYLEKDVSETDRYGRMLRYAYLPDGTFVNAELVRQGFAEAKDYPPDSKYKELLDQAEQEARAAQLGVWAAPLTTPPARAATLPAATSSSPSAASVKIVSVLNKGYKEYVEITNAGQGPQDMAGWTVSGSKGYEQYWFPAGYILEAGAAVRLHSGRDGVDAPPGDIYWTNNNVWNNDGETIYLRDAENALVSEYSY